MMNNEYFIQGSREKADPTTMRFLKAIEEARSQSDVESIWREVLERDPRSEVFLGGLTVLLGNHFFSLESRVTDIEALPLLQSIEEPYPVFLPKVQHVVESHGFIIFHGRFGPEDFELSFPFLFHERISSNPTCHEKQFIEEVLQVARNHQIAQGALLEGHDSMTYLRTLADGTIISLGWERMYRTPTAAQLMEEALREHFPRHFNE